MTVHLEVLVEPGRGLLPSPPPPQTPCTAPHGAYPCPGWMQREESKGSRDGVPRMPSFFSKPRGRLLPAPSHPQPLPQGTSLGFFVKPPGHLGQRAPRCEILRFGAWSADLGQILGWGACRFPRREGVVRGGSRCPACPDLLLGRCAPDPRGGRGWGLEVVTHLRPEPPGHQVGIGRPRHSDFRRSQRTCPQARGWRRGGGRTPRPCAVEHTRSLFRAQLYLFSPPTFLLRALGDGLSPTLPRRLPWPPCNS